MKKNIRNLGTSIGFSLLMLLFARNVKAQQPASEDSSKELNAFIASLPNYADSITIAQNTYDARKELHMNLLRENYKISEDLYDEHKSDLNKYLWSTLSKKQQEVIYNLAKKKIKDEINFLKKSKNFDGRESARKSYIDSCKENLTRLKNDPTYAIERVFANDQEVPLLGSIYWDDDTLQKCLEENPNPKILAFSKSRQRIHQIDNEDFQVVKKLEEETTNKITEYRIKQAEINKMITDFKASLILK